MRWLLPNLWQQHRGIREIHGLQLGPCRLQFGRPPHRRLRPQIQANAPVACPHGHRDRHGLFAVPRRPVGDRFAGLPRQDLAHSPRGPPGVPQQRGVHVLTQTATRRDRRLPPDRRLSAAFHVVHDADAVGPHV